MVAVAKKREARTGTTPTMRLVTGEERSVSRHSRERRVHARRMVSMRVHGKRLDHSLPALRRPTAMFDVRDISAGGLSADTDAPLLPGERIAFTCPTAGFRIGFDTSGRVLRCEPSDLGFRVAVEFESTPSAA